MCFIEYWNNNPEAFLLNQLLERGKKTNAWHQQLKGGFHFIFSTGCGLSGVLPLSTEWQKHFQPQWVGWSLTQNASGHAHPKGTDDQTNRSKRNIYTHTHWKTVWLPGSLQEHSRTVRVMERRAHSVFSSSTAGIQRMAWAGWMHTLPLSMHLLPWRQTIWLPKC